MYSMLNSQHRRCHQKLSRLVPLLLTFAVTQALADETYYIGKAGAAGTNGTKPGAAGTAGGTGELLDLLFPLPQPEHYITITGGRGGNGGNGAVGGDAGAGGMGGSITARVIGTPAPRDEYHSTGGAGGNAGIPGAGGKGSAGGAGGAATNILDFTLTRTFPQSAAWASVTGGSGGSGAVAGVGGAATIDSTVKAENAAAYVNLQAIGGKGGSAVGAGDGAAGGAASTRSSLLAVSGWDHRARAVGGDGGNGIGAGHRGGAGGSASVDANTKGVLVGDAWVSTQGGNGGHGLMGAAGGDGRDVVLQTPLVLSNDNDASRNLEIRLFGVGGIGGDSEGSSAGNGGVADVSLGLQDQRSGTSLYEVTAASGGGGSASGVHGIAANGAASMARGDVSGSGNIKVNVTSTAGDGGSGTGVGGAAGGNANASAISLSTGKATTLATAIGGSGGSATGAGTRGGNGGSAHASATSHGDRSGASATVDAWGGSGGNGTTFGGNGGAANLVNAVVGSTTGTLVLSQRAEGGAGGNGVTPGVGGDATSHLTLVDDKAGTINATVLAFGGLGGSRPVFDDPVAKGGTSDARLDITARALGSTVSAKVRAAAITGSHGEIYYTTGDATARSIVQADRSASSVAEAATGLTSSRPLEPGVLALRANAYARAASNGASTASATALSNGLWGVSNAHAEALGGNQTTLATALGDGHVAHVTAYSNARDGASNTADAYARSDQGSARAESVSTGSNGGRVTTSASVPVVTGSAHVRSSANIGGAIERLPSAPDRNISTATAAPDQTALAALFADAPIVTAAFAHTPVVGAGRMLGYSGVEIPEYTAITTANFQFDTVSPSYLKLGLLNGKGYSVWGSGAPVGQFELTISNHGTEVFSRSFDSLSAATTFFNDDTYFLGELATGSQDLLISAGFTLRDRGAFSFDYVLGVSPVPEPQMWMLMLLGTTVVLLRRRRHRLG